MKLKILKEKKGSQVWEIIPIQIQTHVDSITEEAKKDWMKRGAPWLKSGEKCGRGARVIAHPDLGVGSNGQGETCNFYIAIHLTPVSGDSSKNLSNKFGCLMFGKVRGRSYPLSRVCVILGRMEVIGCLQEEEGLLSREEISIIVLSRLLSREEIQSLYL